MIIRWSEEWTIRTRIWETNKGMVKRLRMKRKTWLMKKIANTSSSNQLGNGASRRSSWKTPGELINGGMAVHCSIWVILYSISSEREFILLLTSDGGKQRAREKAENIKQELFICLFLLNSVLSFISYSTGCFLAWQIKIEIKDSIRFHHQQKYILKKETAENLSVQ